MTGKRCRHSQCTWRDKPKARQPYRVEECSTCGNVFPCAECRHLDCMERRGEPWDVWYDWLRESK